MITTIEIFTVKRSAMALKSLGYKLHNLPLHLRTSSEDDLNRYVKDIEVSVFSELLVIKEEIEAAKTLLNDAHEWFYSKDFVVGCTCVGYIYSTTTEKCSYLWKR